MIKVQVPVEEVIDAAVDSVCDLAEAVQAKLIFEGCQLQITGDPDRLKQAFAKVLTGLLHLCPAGETIRILAEAEAGAGKVIIKVDTTRLVLPDDRLQTIFEPFQQLDLTSTKGSLGLGLPLARAIILRHGGACGATKAAEGGVSLWLQLPLFTAAWGSIAGW
jgi:signal transduction histidine kinase